MEHGKVPEWRKSSYKSKGGTADELRRRREEASVEIRKSKREESLAKRRNFNSADLGADSDEEGAMNNASQEFVSDDGGWMRC